MPPSAFQTQEGAPAHLARAGEPGGPDAQAGDPATEEHGLRAVAGEERIADREHPLALVVETSRPLEQRPAAAAPDHEADVVADDRAGRGDDDHRDDRQLVLAGGEAGEDHRRLTRQRNAERLDPDEQPEQREAQVLRDAEEACQHGRRRRGAALSRMPRCPRCALSPATRRRARAPASCAPRTARSARPRSCRSRPRAACAGSAPPRSRRSATTSCSATPSTCSCARGAS